MHLFYAPVIEGNACILDEEESVHCLRVMRLREGDEIFVTDGKGSLFKAKITSGKNKKCEVEIIEKQTSPEKNKFRVHIAIAPTKNNERMEWFAEKATEIGIDEITPVICDHSERRVLKTERLKKVLLAAMKQSFRTWLPEVNEPVPLKKFLQLKHEGHRFIARHGAAVHLKNAFEKNQPVLILIGPEGDFSAEELIFAKENGFIEVSLGDFRLRTETAALVACQVVNFVNS